MRHTHQLVRNKVLVSNSSVPELDDHMLPQRFCVTTVAHLDSNKEQIVVNLKASTPAPFS